MPLDRNEGPLRSGFWQIGAKLSPTGYMTSFVADPIHPVGKLVNAAAGPVLDHVLRFREFSEMYRRMRYDGNPDGYLFSRLAKAMPMTYRLEGAHNILRNVSALYVGNHPLSLADATALMSALFDNDGRAKLYSNPFLTIFPEVEQEVLTMSRRSTPSEQRQEIAMLNGALENNGSLVLYPSGHISTPVGSSDGRAVDGPWHNGLFKFAAKRKLPIIPVFTFGEPSPWLQWLKIYLPNVAPAMNASEAVSNFGRHVLMRMGPAVMFDEYRAVETAKLADYFRELTYSLRR